MTDAPATGSISSTLADPWPAPVIGKPVNATVQIPGSKSLTNRYLVMAALADGPSTLHGILDSRDTHLMITALRHLGADISIHDDDPTTVEVVPIPTEAAPKHPDVSADSVVRTVDCGLAGTVMRFVPAVAALTPYTVDFDGDASARLRPMAPVLDGLAQAGTEFGTAPTHLPFRIYGTGEIRGGTVAVDAGGSSQFLSALLLAGARFTEGLHLIHTGDHTPSPEHVAMTVSVLRAAGVTIDDTVARQWRVSPGPITAGTQAVEPDLSNAGPYLAAAVATGGRVTVPYWPLQTTQIGDRWREILPRFGATVELIPQPGTAYGTLTVSGHRNDDGTAKITAGGQIADTAELAPTVAALSVLAEGTTTLTGIGHLRGHETDRLTGLSTEIQRLGGTVVEGAGSLRITGSRQQLAPARLRTYHDHRMATFAAVIGLGVPGITIENIVTTSKTMPNFPHAWTQVVATAGHDQHTDPNSGQVIPG